MSLLHRMATASVTEQAGLALASLGTATTIFAGAFYSTLLAAIFAPAELYLRWLATTRAPLVATDDSTNVDKWLEKHGFEPSLPRTMLRLMAILSPLLAGVLQNVVQLE